MESNVSMSPKDFLASTESDILFASNHFDRSEAERFFSDLEALGARVEVDNVRYDFDGPGEHYTDSCIVYFDNATNTGQIIVRIQIEKPGEMEFNKDTNSVWVWWD